jgi:V/A-type H+-transporting ATPase subunit E
MEVQLQELIDKIKQDGVKAAMEDADRVKKEAQDEAARIIADANKQAASIAAKAKEEQARFEKAGAAAVEQASRNVILAFRKQIEEILSKVAVNETATAMDSAVMKEGIAALLQHWDFSKEKPIEVLVPEKDLDAITEYLKGKLAAEMSKGLEVKPAKNIPAGFRIAEKDGAAFYDFSAESVAACFSAYVNPKVAEIIKAAAAGAQK